MLLGILLFSFPFFIHPFNAGVWKGKQLSAPAVVYFFLALLSRLSSMFFACIHAFTVPEKNKTEVLSDLPFVTLLCSVSMEHGHQYD